MLANIGTTELVLIALILIFLFGGKKIPEIIKSLSKAIDEFKKSSK